MLRILLVLLGCWGCWYSLHAQAVYNDEEFVVLNTGYVQVVRNPTEPNVLYLYRPGENLVRISTSQPAAFFKLYFRDCPRAQRRSQGVTLFNEANILRLVEFYNACERSTEKPDLQYQTSTNAAQRLASPLTFRLGTVYNQYFFNESSQFFRGRTMEPALGLSAAIHGHFPVTPHWGISPLLGLSRQTGQGSFIDNIQGVPQQDNVEFAYTYLQLGLGPRYVRAWNDRSGWLAGAGVGMGYAISREDKITSFFVGSPNDIPLEVPFNPDKSFMYLSFSPYYRVGKLQLSLELRYHREWLNIASNNQLMKPRAHALHLGLGVGF